MALRPCRECGSPASWSARACPACGARKPVPRPDFDLYHPSTWQEAPLWQRIRAVVLLTVLVSLAIALATGGGPI